MEEVKTFTNGFKVHEVPWKIYIKQKKNQVFKLLPLKEEEGDWEKQLETILVEIGGLNNLTSKQEFDAITIQTKLSGLKTNEIEFEVYRKTVFEIINLLENL